VAAACAAASKNIRTPFVFCSVYYPLNAGAGRTASDHLPNVTGAGCPPPLEETVRAVKTLLPAAAKAGTVFNSSEANSSRAVSKARKLFAGMKISLEAVSVQSTNEISEALRALKAKDIQFLWLTGDNTVLQCFPMIADFCAKNSLPLTVNDTEICGGGAVLACGTGFYRNGRAGGLIAARVLQGENPADIPIETTVTADIVLNFAPAKKLGLTFPSGLVERSVRFLNLKERLGRPLRIAALKAGGAADSGAEAGFLKGLKAAGLVEGADFLVRDCENKPELKNGKYDLVFLCGPPAAGDSSGLPESVPVVSASADGADLKKNGLEASLAAARILAGARPDRVTVKIPPEAGDTAGSL
jgi:ABC-type uncharacterized transport system substrate-binding protein